jgi:hypothetical protein
MLCLPPSFTGPTAVQAKGSRPGLRSVVTAAVQNEFIEMMASDGGRYVVGTTGGDPDSDLDNYKQLLYGYPGDVGTSFATLRIVDGATTSDYRLGSVDYVSTGIAPEAPPVTDTTSITTTYIQSGVRVLERVYVAPNMDTGRYDTTAIEYTIINESGYSRSVGLRMLLDIMVGDNDGAPYFIEGQGYVTRQSEWYGTDVPSYWVSYESPIFLFSSLKGRGQLVGGDAVRPDRFVIADWNQATYTTWDYTVKSNSQVTKDSATILYYNPATLGPGQRRVVRTYYGIAHAGGVSMVQLNGLEVTQGIQDLLGSVPLIQNRPTYVRAHVRSTLGTIPGVTAQLAGTRGGMPLPGSPLAPANVGGSISVLEYPDRQQLNQSLLFSLPTTWLSGTVDLELQGVNRVIGCRDQIGTANDCKAEVSFGPAPAPQVHFVGVNWSKDGVVHAPTQTDLDAVQRQIESAFPVPGLVSSYGANIAPGFSNGGPSSQEDFIILNSQLSVNRILDGCVSSGIEGCKTYYLGVLIDQPQSVINGGMTAGKPPVFVASGYISDWLAEPHEFAAATGQMHTLCRGDEDQPTQVYPYPDSKISLETGGDQAFFGFNTSSRTVYSPSTRDLMSHCLPRWTSDYSYISLKGYLESIYGAASPVLTGTPQAGNGSVLVSGILTYTIDTGRFLSTYVLPTNNGGTVPAPGNYSIRLERGDGQVLASYPFVPNTSSEDGTYGSFTLLLPWDPGASRIVLAHGARVLDTKRTSSTPPSVTVLYPNGGENLTGSSATVRWTASDADGDPLTYIVQYSKDNGATWQTLASQWPSMTYTLDLTTLPGTDQGLMRIMAGDGVFTSQDQSDATFRVARHSPVATITAPQENALFTGNQSVLLEGFATDVEDGSLGDTALTWSSNRDGALGTGHSVVVNSLSLQEGMHTITLQAQDSNGQTGVATRTIQVSRAQPPVAAYLAVAPAEMQFTAKCGTQQTAWQSISIDNGGDGSLSWTVSLSEPWLLASAPDGSTPANLLVAASPVGMRPGTYVGAVTISADGATNSPQVLTVRLSCICANWIYLPVIVGGAGM